MKIRTSALLLVAALALSSCGASHRAEKSGAVTSRQTVTSRTTTSPPKLFSLALISARSGAVLHLSKLPVASAVADGRDGWFVSGGFGLARLLPNGKLDSAWGTRESRNLNCSRCGLVKSGSRLYVAGQRFEVVPGTVGEARVSVVEAFDASTGARLWVGSAPSRDVYALAASSTRVYVGGAFTSVGNVKRQGLAAFDATTGRLLDWRAPSFHLSDTTSHIGALALSGSRLYVGGLFEAVGDKSRNYIAALDPATGALLPWNPKNAGSAAYSVFEILVTRGQVVIAGDDGFAAASARTGRQLGWTSSIGGNAGRFAADGPLVYLGGGLRDPIRAFRGNNLAAFNLKTGRLTSWAPKLAPYVDVGGIVPSGGQVLVTGMFTDSIG